MNETWREIEGFPDYKVSNSGKILSNRIGAPRVLKGYKYKEKNYDYGAIRVQLRKPSGGKLNTYIHVLVMDAFGSSKPTPSAIIKHKNGNYYDNRIENLEWGEHAFSDGVDNVINRILVRAKKIAEERNLLTTELLNELLDNIDASIGVEKWK